MVSNKIVNIVGTSKIGENFDLHSLALTLEGAEYEPEQFPGLVYRHDKPKVVFLIFNSGKVVCTGATCETDVDIAVDMLKKKLEDIHAVRK